MSWSLQVLRRLWNIHTPRLKGPSICLVMCLLAFYILSRGIALSTSLVFVYCKLGHSKVFLNACLVSMKFVSQMWTTGFHWVSPFKVEIPEGIKSKAWSIKCFGVYTCLYTFKSGLQSNDKHKNWLILRIQISFFWDSKSCKYKRIIHESLFCKPSFNIDQFTEYDVTFFLSIICSNSQKVNYSQFPISSIIFPQFLFATAYMESFPRAEIWVQAFSKPTHNIMTIVTIHIPHPYRSLTTDKKK